MKTILKVTLALVGLSRLTACSGGDFTAETDIESRSSRDRGRPSATTTTHKDHSSKGDGNANDGNGSGESDGLLGGGDSGGVDGLTSGGGASDAVSPGETGLDDSGDSIGGVGMTLQVIRGCSHVGAQNAGITIAGTPHGVAIALLDPKTAASVKIFDDPTLVKATRDDIIDLGFQPPPTSPTAPMPWPSATARKSLCALPASPTGA